MHLEVATVGTPNDLTQIADTRLLIKLSVIINWPAPLHTASEVGEEQRIDTV